MNSARIVALATALTLPYVVLSVAEAQHPTWTQYQGIEGKKALAVGTNGAVGIGYKGLSNFAVKLWARKTCRQYGGANCKVVLVNENLDFDSNVTVDHISALHDLMPSSKAVATDNNGTFGFSWDANSEDEATAGALSSCGAASNKACSILFTQGIRYEPPPPKLVVPKESDWD